MKLFDRLLGKKPTPPPLPPPPVVRRWPNFFICGAARSGTTSMWQYLRQHPEIFMPEEFGRKEPCFFCENKRGFGMENQEEYLDLFTPGANHKLIGEASGPYLTSPESPALIRAQVPSARFIIILRNPADRAYSLYKWMHQYRYETVGTFQQALDAEAQSRFENAEFKVNNGQYYHNFLYFHSGLYAAQVQRFFDTFGKPAVRVLIFEELVRDALRQVQETYAFLGVDASFVPRLEVHNPTSADYAEFDPALRQQLLSQYAPDIARLEMLMGRSLREIWK